MKAISTTTNSTSARMLICRGSFGVSAVTGALRAADALRAVDPVGLPRGRGGTAGGVLRVPAEPARALALLVLRVLPGRPLVAGVRALALAGPLRADAPLPAARERLRGVGGRRVVTSSWSRSVRRLVGNAGARVAGQHSPPPGCSPRPRRRRSPPWQGELRRRTCRTY